MNNYEILAQTVLPKSLHGINPRTIMGQAKWNKLRQEKLAEADHHCMACGEFVPDNHLLDCHEVYQIDMDKKEFKLVDIVCLCKKCHDYIHMGRLQMLMGQGLIAREYYNEVMMRGDELLESQNLKKQNLPFDEINNPNWYLLYDGKKYSNKM